MSADSLYTELSASGASRDDVPATHPLIIDRAEENQKSWSDDSNWKGCGSSGIGCLYHGKNDSRLCVRRRCVRLSPPFLWIEKCEGHCGCSVNVSHRYGCVTLIAVVLILLIGEGISWTVTLFNKNL